jgi:hypothetical protein
MDVRAEIDQNVPGILPVRRQRPASTWIDTSAGGPAAS